MASTLLLIPVVLQSSRQKHSLGVARSRSESPSIDEENFRATRDYYEIPFNNAKYRVGQNQYDLVNQYVEVAAKNDMWKCFKKGIEWAQYLGIEIRWLRNDEPTEEKLKYVYEMMKLVSYGHQM